MLTLGFGTLKALMYTIVFSIALVMYFSWLFLGLLVLYSVIGTLLTHYIAKPLISLNYQQQRLEATYRNDLTISNFQDCVSVMLGLAKKQKHLTYFQQLYGQVGVILPLVAMAPVYFTTDMGLGLLMRFNSSAATIIENLSYGINSFASINRLISCRRRLTEVGVI
jgi:putative ATP-binding cassette transporter